MRKKIINLLSKKPLSKNELKEKLNILSQSEIMLFENILRKLFTNKYVASKNGKLILLNNPLESIGRFSLMKDGYGFVDTKSESFYVNKNNTLNSQSGDRVKYMEIRKGRNGSKSEARVIEILEKNIKRLTGEIIKPVSKDKIYSFKPFSYLDYSFDIACDFNLTIGDIVSGDVINQDINNKKIELKILEIIGQVGDNDLDLKQIIFEKNIKTQFSDELLDYVDKIKIDWKKENNDRKDLTKETIVTIDGESAKDLDDAIMIKKIGKNYLLNVSIADVSYFVTKDSVLDIEAFSRGTSIYFTNKVIPMLPKRISNDLASLNEDGKKLTLTCEMLINKDGYFEDIKIYPSIIKSTGRLTYTEVNKLLKTKKDIPNKAKEISSMLLIGLELSEILSKRRKFENMINFKLGEVKIQMDEDNNVTGLDIRHQDIAEHLIENLMVAANEAVATWFFKNRISSVYRVHEPPIEEELFKFMATLKLFGIDNNLFGKNLKPSPGEYQKVIDLVDKEKYGFLIKKLAITTMTKAIYDFRNKGHFGLGLRNYTHFTSPIRRYPDLIVHRLLRYHLFEGNTKPLYSNLSDITIRTSFTEKRAQEAERQFVDKKVSLYMGKFIGDEFIGYIIAIKKWGIFIQLRNTIEGIILVRDLNDKYDFDQKTNTLVNEDKTESFHIGMELNVRLKSIDRERGIAEFTIVEKYEDNKQE